MQQRKSPFGDVDFFQEILETSVITCHYDCRCHEYSNKCRYISCHNLIGGKMANDLTVSIRLNSERVRDLKRMAAEQTLSRGNGKSLNMQDLIREAVDKKYFATAPAFVKEEHDIANEIICIMNNYKRSTAQTGEKGKV